MAFYGKTWPIGLAPGMGINAFVAFGVVAGMGYSPQAALEQLEDYNPFQLLLRTQQMRLYPFQALGL